MTRQHVWSGVASEARHKLARVSAWIHLLTWRSSSEWHGALRKESSHCFYQPLLLPMETFRCLIFSHVETQLAHICFWFLHCASDEWLLVLPRRSPHVGLSFPSLEALERNVHYAPTRQICGYLLSMYVSLHSYGLWKGVEAGWRSFEGWASKEVGSRGLQLVLKGGRRVLEKCWTVV